MLPMDYVKANGCYQLLLPPDDAELSSLTCNVAIADITKFSPGDFAKQITLIEISLFKAIKREEFSSLKWNGKEKHNYAPNIVASTKWFNQINFWVQKEILKYSCVSKRTELLSFFIKVAKKLVEVNNLYSAMSIVSALQVECIYRLRHTWSGLGNKDRTTYRRLEELFSQDDNCRRQREHMNSITLPGIPYLGLYLSDLTYTNVAHPRAGGKTTDVWSKKINAIIDAIAHFQRSEYLFLIDESIYDYLCAQRYIEELQKFLEEDNYKTSVRLEPPPSTPPVTHTSTSSYTSPVVEKERKLSAFLGTMVPDSGVSGPFKALPSLAASFQGLGFRSPSQPRGSSNCLMPKSAQASVNQSTKAASVNCSFQDDPLPSSLASDFDASLITPTTPIGRSEKPCPAFTKKCPLSSSAEVLVEDEFVRENVFTSDFTKPIGVTEFKQPCPPDPVTPIKRAPHNAPSDSCRCTQLDSKLISSSYGVTNLSGTGDACGESCTHHHRCHCQQYLRSPGQPYQAQPIRPLLINSTIHSPTQPPTVPPRRSIDTTSSSTIASAVVTDAADSPMAVWCPRSTSRPPPSPSERHLHRSHLASHDSLDSVDGLVYNSTTLYGSQSRSASLPVSRSESTQMSHLNMTPGAQRLSIDRKASVSTRHTVDSQPTVISQISLDAVAAAAAATAIRASGSDIITCPPHFKLTGTTDCELDMNGLTRSMHDGAVNAIDDCEIDQTPSCSTQSLLRPVADPPINLGVSVIFQGILQRRRIITPPVSDSHTQRPLASPSPWLKHHQQHLSNSSLSYFGTPTGGSSIRSLNFSRWRRFWASLVRVDHPSGPYGLLILFEAIGKNATRKDQFHTSQCHIQRLVDVSNVSECLASKNFTDAPTDQSVPVVNCQKSEWSTTIVPNFLLARVCRAYHQNGSVDKCSFLLTHPAQNRIYRYRPIILTESHEFVDKSLIRNKTLHQQSPGLIGWLRRSFTHRRNQSLRGSCDLIDDDTGENVEESVNSHQSSPPRSFGTVVRGTSVSTQDHSPPRTPPLRSRGNTLPSARNNSIDVSHYIDYRKISTPYNSLSRGTVELVSDAWIRSLQSVLDNCEQYWYAHTTSPSTGTQ